MRLIEFIGVCCMSLGFAIVFIVTVTHWGGKQ